jgi:hypothetical protein
LQEALIDNTKTPPDEQAAFRIDFPNWLTSLDQRRGRIAEELVCHFPKWLPLFRFK